MSPATAMQLWAMQGSPFSSRKKCPENIRAFVVAIEQNYLGRPPLPPTMVECEEAAAPPPNEGPLPIE